jgi:Arc/MetJ-type ribon-helix-helix transcriptional regulator
MTIHLPENLERSILEEVRVGHFATADDAVAEAVRLFLQQRSPKVTDGVVETGPQPERPIWEDILELTADVPDEEWDKLPPDLAEQHDHYIYGTPKRPAT